MSLRKVLIILILLLAFLLRFNQVTSDPPSLNWDEVSIAYNAYSVMRTGQDEWGQFLPIHFKAFGEYKLPAQIYFSIPGIWLFGLNELGVRITPVVYGSLTVLLLYLLAKRMFENETIALISAFLLSISPWHIQLTRASFESSFSVFWVILGLWLQLKALNTKQGLWWLLGSVVSFAISIYTYNSARVFSPLFILFLTWYFRDWIFKHLKQFIPALILFLILMVPLVQFVLQTGGNSRYKLVSVTDDPGLIPRIEFNRNHSNLPNALNVLINNRYTYISYYVIGNYLAHFSPQFLFLTGAPHHQHNVQDQGEFYLFQAPLILYGVWVLYKRKIKYRGILIAWILLAFIPVSVTNDSTPNALRTVLAVIPYEIISAFGGYLGFKFIKERNKKLLPVLGIVSVLVVALSLGFYLYNYYFIYPVKYSRDWQYGYKQAIEYVQTHQSQYDQIVFSRTYGEPHIFMLFFTKFDPAKYLADKNLVRYEDHQWIWVYHFDKYYFPDLGDPGSHYQDWVAQNPGKKILFVGKPGDFGESKPILDHVNFLNGDGAFEIVEN